MTRSTDGIVNFLNYYSNSKTLSIECVLIISVLIVVFLFLKGRHLPDKAIDLVDEACANVRVQLDSQPEEIDNLERKRIQLEVELHALEKEKDKASKARLVEVGVCHLFSSLSSFSFASYPSNIT